MFFKYKTQIKYTLFSVLALAVGLIVFKPTNVYAVTQSNTRQEHVSMYTHYHDGYSISINDGVVQGGEDDARYNVDADNYWMDGFSASVWGDYDGSISYSIHCHNLAWTSTFANGTYVSGPGYFGGVTTDWRVPYSWIEAITVEMSGDVNNFYYFNYEAYPVMATYDYVDRTTMPLATGGFPQSTWENGYAFQRQWRKPGMDWNEAGADMANWNGKNWIGTTGCAMPLCGARGSLTKRPCTLSINPNGGTLGDKTDVQTYNCKADETFSSIGIPTKKGYTFAGWKVDYTWQQINAENDYQAVTNNYAPRSGGLNGTEVASGTITGGNFTNATLWIGNCRTVRLTAQWTANNYNQSVNYYTYKASGPYNNITHTWNLLGTKSWNKTYGSVMDAYSVRAAWGNVAGYHWWSINNNSWTVTGDGTTNSHYYPNKYRLNVNVNGGSGTNGNYDMEYGTYINLGTPTKTGYTFDGWKISTNNSTGSSLSGTTFTMGYNKTYPYQDYVGAVTIKITAQWYSNSYNIFYDLNDSIGSTSAQFGANHPNSVKFDTLFTVSNPTRPGYTFAGWNITGMDTCTHYYGDATSNATNIEGTCESQFKNLNSNANAVVTFKALWTPNEYIIRFDGNGASEGHVEDIVALFDQNILLPINNYLLDRNTFVGWTHDENAHVGTYMEEATVLSTDVIVISDIIPEKNTIITLYCAWDPAPNITVYNKTFTLDEARNGLITEEQLFEGTYAIDEILDLEIAPGVHELEDGKTNSFLITNYSEYEFCQFTDSGSTTITYQVIDSVGNITEETITVFIVNTDAQDVLAGEGTYRVRFISGKYYDKDETSGGLSELSIWRCKEEYVSLLSQAMGE